MPNCQPQEIMNIADYHKELTHVWGLSGKVEVNDGTKTVCLGSAEPIFLENDGWAGVLYLNSNLKRFSRIQSYISVLDNITPPKFWHICTKISDTDRLNIAKEIDELKVNHMISFDIETEKHVSSLHIIKTMSGYEAIYVNRGDKSFLNIEANVHVYRFTTVLPIHNLLHVCSTIEKDYENNSKKKAIANVLNGVEWSDYYCPARSLLLKKESQKVGNCTVANLNISWHLALALEKVKMGEVTTYLTGYLLSSAQYRQMRIYDRAIKLIELVINSEKYSESSYYALILAIVSKVSRKNDFFCIKLLEAVYQINKEIYILLLIDLKQICDSKFVSQNYDGVLKNVLDCTFKYDYKNSVINQDEVINAAQNFYTKMLSFLVSIKDKEENQKLKTEITAQKSVSRPCTFKFLPVKSRVFGDDVSVEHGCNLRSMTIR